METGLDLGGDCHPDGSLGGHQVDPRQLGQGRLADPAGAGHVQRQVAAHQLGGRLPHRAGALHGPVRGGDHEAMAPRTLVLEPHEHLHRQPGLSRLLGRPQTGPLGRVLQDVGPPRLQLSRGDLGEGDLPGQQELGARHEAGLGRQAC